jgi:hypothetical protein
MNIIELIIYIALLSTFLVGSIFSAYSMLTSVLHDNDAVDQVQSSVRRDTNGGFVAITSSVIIATTLMLFAVLLSGKVATLYDITMRSEYRVIVKAHTYACFDRALLKLAQDYFYIPGSGGDYFSAFECSVDSVIIPSKDKRIISVSAMYQGIQGKITAEVLMDPHAVQILQKNFILF